MVITTILQQIELQAKLLNYFLGSNKSNINQSSRDLKLKFISIRKEKTEKEKVKHTHRFKDRISVIQQR